MTAWVFRPRPTGDYLGAHLLAGCAGDVIQAAVMALKYRATIDEIADTSAPT
jgi:pyruvate/2-oxoglutarate dehydrogenase complex dihydrolipoamide dehydrogenase (E3) component